MGSSTGLNFRQLFILMPMVIDVKDLLTLGTISRLSKGPISFIRLQLGDPVQPSKIFVPRSSRF